MGFLRFTLLIQNELKLSIFYQNPLNEGLAPVVDRICFPETGDPTFGCYSVSLQNARQRDPWNGGVTMKSRLTSGKYQYLSRTSVVSFLFILFLHLHVFSQESGRRFNRVGQNELSDKLAWCILKDDLGFMWFGTTEGLYRYNGTDVRTYKYSPSNSTSICHNNINAIGKDNENNLWIGTSRGLALYDREKDNFIDINALPQNENTLNNVYITSLAADRNGKVWIGTRGGGINIYDKNASRFTYIYAGNDKDNYRPCDYVMDMVADGQKIWAATRAGLKAFDIDTFQPEAISSSDDNVLTKQITCITKGNDRNLWISTLDGEIFELTCDNDFYTVKKYGVIKKEDGTPAAIIRLSKEGPNNLWIATENVGLKLLDMGKNKLTHYQLEEGNPYSIPSHEIRCVYVDDQGIVWFGSNYKGVYFIDNKSKKFELHQRNPYKSNTLRSDNVNAFVNHNDGYIWIASDSGLNNFSLKNRAFVPDDVGNRIGNKPITALLKDSRNTLWLGTKNNGVIQMNLKTLETRRFDCESSGSGNNKILSIYEDRLQTIWVGTLGSGLFYYDPEREKFISLSERDKPNYIPDRAYVTSILETSDSTIWVGTLYGLYNLKRDGTNTYAYTSYFQNNDDPNSVSSDRIQVIYEDARKHLWFGTVDNGLSLWLGEKKGFKTIQPVYDDPLYSVRGILEDGNEILWISSNDGLIKFDPQTNTSKKYTRFEGMNSNTFNPNACLKLATTELLFGGNNGFNIFQPDSIKDNTNPPTMWLTDFKINNQQVTIGDKNSPLTKQVGLTRHVSLTYDQRSFTIDFIGINYGSSSRNQYYYKLQGFDKDWNYVGQNHSAVYTNLDPGDYVFLAKGSNSDGVWTTSPARLEITILPPFWKRWWAILTYIVILTSVLYFLSRVRLERLKMVNRLNLEKMAREKEHELTLSKMQFFTNISHEIRTPLSLISIPIENLASTLHLPNDIKKSMHVAHKNVMYLTRLITELMDFSKIDNSALRLKVQYGELVKFITEVASSFEDISDKRNIAFTINPTLPVINGWFDREKIEKVILNILSNAFKFTPDNGTINVLINANNQELLVNNGVTGRRLELVITDNGIGISAEELPHIFDKFFQAKSAYQVQGAGTGIGLSLAKGLLELHRGSIKAASVANTETTFTITFPIDREAYPADEVEDTPIDIISEPEHINHQNHNGHIADNSTERPEILLVEDNDELRNLLVSELAPEFSVIESRDGQEGIALAIEKTPDLIISDVVMPQKSGLDLCSTIKADLRTSHIPVILLTAKTTIEDQVGGLESGADIYITKPFSIRVLKSHARQITTSRKKLYAHFSQDAYPLPTQATNNEIDKEFLKKVIDFIHENILDDKLSIESVAEELNLSKTQFYKKIKTLTGQTAVEFIRSIRLKYALTLMDTKRYTLAEIAYQAGFSSPSYFTRSFKEQFGKPPSEYVR